MRRVGLRPLGDPVRVPDQLAVIGDQHRDGALPGELLDLPAPLGHHVHQPGPDAETEKKAEYVAVMAGLQQLPELDRAALLMSAFEGMPYAEIARALGISLAAVKMKIHRSRLALSRLEVPK